MKCNCNRFVVVIRGMKQSKCNGFVVVTRGMKHKCNGSVIRAMKHKCNGFVVAIRQRTHKHTIFL